MRPAPRQSLADVIDVFGTRGDIERPCDPSIGTIDGEVAGPFGLGLGPPPLAIGVVPSLLVELPIVACYDWKTRGRPHPAWLIGGAIITAVILIRGPIAGTPAWLGIADFLSTFAR
jgi:hypothetical protein